MKTPNRNHKQNTTKAEDSPVYNFIDNLSPLQPIRSGRIFTSFNFSSPPSVFTSPHVCSNRESQFRKSQQSPDPSNSKSALQDEFSTCCNEDASAQLGNNSAADLQDNFDPGDFIVETNIETPGKQLKNITEKPITLNDLHRNAEGNGTTCCHIETDVAMELAGTQEAVVPVLCRTSETVSEENSQIQEMCQTVQKVEGLRVDSDGDAADLLMFSSPANAETFDCLMQKRFESESNIGTSNMSEYPQDKLNYVQKQLLIDPVGPGKQHETEGHRVQLEESIEPSALEPVHENLAISNSDRLMARSLGEITENQPISDLHCGILRRCLDFEMVGGHENTEFNGPYTALLSQSDGMVTPLNKQLVPFTPGTDTSRCALPGFGLHVKSIGTTTSEEFKHLNHEAFSSEKRELRLQGTTSSCNVAQTEQDSIKDAGFGHQLAKQASESFTKEECNLTSPKKKRRKVESVGETEACKRCNCKKSKCLKLYCECFAAGVYCIESCSCQDCLNKPIHEDTVLATRRQIESRNPLAFAPKVIMVSDPTPDTGDEYSNTPSSARHKRGCNCKRSSCLKKYCECYQGGVGCSMNCRCESCKNVFGRKEGSAVTGKHVEPEVESETCEKTKMGNSLQKTDIQDTEEQLPASANAKTPLQLGRPLVQLPISSKGRPSRSSSIMVRSSSGLFASHKLVKPDFLQPQPKFKNQLQSVPEDEMSEILHDNYSPGSGVKTASPTSKRVSPPSRDTGSSPRQGGRKLILQSIPSFPSLTLQH